jgi:small subunit ribosomal protein S7
MSRRRKAEQRKVEPDPKYQSMILTRFTNRAMMGGKKSTAQRSIYKALEKLEQETNRPGIETFDKAIKNVMPAVEVKPRRIGGATYQVPVEVRPERQLALAIRWIVEAARSKSGMPFADRVFQELLDASNKQGVATKKKDEIYRMAEANRAFAHYRW